LSEEEMTTITTYQTDESGIFLYADKAQQFALDPDRYNVAFRAVLKKPPKTPKGKRARWASDKDATDPGFLDGVWIVEDIPTPEAETGADPIPATDEPINPQ
jgi:hypothetical protein